MNTGNPMKYNNGTMMTREQQLARVAAIDKMVKCQVVGQTLEKFIPVVTACHATRACDIWRQLARMYSPGDSVETLAMKYAGQV